jgi:hypothetical protein
LRSAPSKPLAAEAGKRKSGAEPTEAPAVFDFDAIKQRLPEYLVRIRAEPRINGDKLVCRCPLHEDRTPSFQAKREASGVWVWFCHPCGVGGTVIDLHMKCTGLSTAEAVRELAALFGAPAQPDRILRRPGHSSAVTQPLPAIPPDAARAWFHGLDYLSEHPALIAELAKWRGWPAEWAQYLVDCASLSMPLYHERRTTAFLVSAPVAIGGRLAMRDIGFHARLRPQEGEKASWRFVPNETEDGQTTPAFPFIIGAGWFDTARLLVIAGGQWDALTFAFAAGWLGDGCEWPDGVCVLGLRGDASSDTFLDAYRRFWPRRADCILLPDDDASGSKWHECKDSFAVRLARVCRKVAVIACVGQKDFNDLYRAEKITPEQIAELLALHGMALETGATA